MRISIRVAAVLAALGTFAGCGEDGSASYSERAPDYDAELLEEYRAALPREAELTARAPEVAADPSALTEQGNATLAALAAKSARDINAPARALVLAFKKLTQVKPTLYDGKEEEFVWGPWDNEDGFGQVLAYIRKNPKGDDFAFSYALVRLVDGDLDTAAPVIAGAGTPARDGAEQGAGVALWDFVANTAFEAEHDPKFDADAARDQGRFAMVFGRGQKADGQFAFNVAVFRDFVSKDEPATAPADLDYFFGHFSGADGNTLDFVDWTLTTNLCEAEPDTCFKQPADGASETLGLRAAFFNRGAGRCEAQVNGGDLTQMVNVVECWDAAIDRTAIEYRVDSDVLSSTGACDGAFAADLEALGVPSLADVDDDVLDKLDCVASNGFAACAK